ncbi:Uncharacterized protein C2orf24-like protein, partial [Anas platyrhynchos]
SSSILDIAVELLQKVAPSPIRRLQKKYVSHVSRQVVPGLTVCLLQLHVAPWGGSSQVVPRWLGPLQPGNNFGDGACLVPTGKLALEMNFLSAIDWSLYTDPRELFEVLSWLEGRVAEKQGTWRGWFTYTDLCVLMEQSAWQQALGQFYQQVLKLACLLGVLYLTGFASLFASVAIVHRAVCTRSSSPAALRPAPLPLVQIPSFEYLVPAVVLSSHLSRTDGNGNGFVPGVVPVPAHLASIPNSLPGTAAASLREVSGAVVVSGLIQVALGMSGVCGWAARRCGPMVLAPSLSIIGLSAYKDAASLCSASWGVALLLMLLTVTFSQHLGSCRLPFCAWPRAPGGSVEPPVPTLSMLSSTGAFPHPHPDPCPRAGGVLCVTYAVAVGTGISYFQYADIDSGRNIFIVGFAMFMALLVPRWLGAAPAHLATGWVPLDLLFLSLLMVPVFLTGFLSFFLENTVSGTPEERGLLQKTGAGDGERGKASSVYGLPAGLRRLLPSCKAFPCCFLCPEREEEEEKEEEDEEDGCRAAEEGTAAAGEGTRLLLKPGSGEAQDRQPGQEEMLAWHTGA